MRTKLGKHPFDAVSQESLSGQKRKSDSAAARAFPPRPPYAAFGIATDFGCIPAFASAK